MVDLSFDSGQDLEKIYVDSSGEVEKLSAKAATDVFKYGGLASEYNELEEWKKLFKSKDKQVQKLYKQDRSEEFKKINSRIETLQKLLKKARENEINKKHVKGENVRRGTSRRRLAGKGIEKTPEAKDEEKRRFDAHKKEIKDKRQKKDKENKKKKRDFENEKDNIEKLINEMNALKLKCK